MPDRGPIHAYRRLVAEGALSSDASQQLGIEKLQVLHEALIGYDRAPASRTQGGWREKLGLVRNRGIEAPQGLYIYGPVGRGKSMLMDLFFENAPVRDKQRVHFNAFMQAIQKEVHIQRKVGFAGNMIPTIATHVARRATLLAFDEFQVEDIADAMVLGRLFEALLNEGVVIVATSNVSPRNLYRDGLQRERFLPFIDLIMERFDVLALDGGQDYRRLSLAGKQVYFTPLGDESTAALDAAFLDLTGQASGEPARIAVRGRHLTVPNQARGVARMDFDALCRRPLGPADFLGLAENFHTLVLDGVPRIPAPERDVARRFITLIDSLYEKRANIVISADVPPDSIYDSGDASFQFQRTASRLIEMQSRAYIEQPHGGLDADCGSYAMRGAGGDGR